MKQKINLGKLSFIVLTQVAIFVLVYLLTIALGAALIYAVVRASVWFIPHLFDYYAPEFISAGYIGVIILGILIIAIFGLWTFVLAVGVYLIKPLFIFPKKDNDYGIELSRKDSPELYDLIQSTARAVGVKSPKHIYITHELNACAFVNAGFWNIIFPVRKNLILGLALFESTSIEELKGVIAHEFGHFAQDSMRVGSILFVANKVISDLAYRRDALDALMVKWCLKRGVWGFWGKATQAVVIRLRALIDFLFRAQQRNYAKLSRQMEYDADAMACKVVGSETYISALCKGQRLGNAFDFYNRVLDGFAERGHTVPNYWQGYAMTIPRIDFLEMHSVAYDKLELSPGIENAVSRVSIEDVWETHPSLDKRIEYAKALNIFVDKHPQSPAWSLVNETLKSVISESLINRIRETYHGVEIFTWDEYSESLDKLIDTSVFPKEFEPFFNRDILTYCDSAAEMDAEPLSDANRRIIRDYEQALRDKALLEQLKQRAVPVKHFKYDDAVYNIKNVPLVAHNRYLSALKNTSGKIDASIKALALSKSADSQYIHAAYMAIEYAQSIVRRIEDEFQPARAAIIEALNAGNIGGAADLEGLMSWLESYETALKELLKLIEYQKIAPLMTKEEYDIIMEYIKASKAYSLGIDIEDVNHMFNVTEWINRVHCALSHDAKILIINTIGNKELPDIAFIAPWVPM